MRIRTNIKIYFLTLLSVVRFGRVRPFFACTKSQEFNSDNSDKNTTDSPHSLASLQDSNCVKTGSVVELSPGPHLLALPTSQEGGGQLHGEAQLEPVTPEQWMRSKPCLRIILSWEVSWNCSALVASLHHLLCSSILSLPPPG